jgi:hypothetical protein
MSRLEGPRSRESVSSAMALTGVAPLTSVGGANREDHRERQGFGLGTHPDRSDRKAATESVESRPQGRTPVEQETPRGSRFGAARLGFSSSIDTTSSHNGDGSV